MDTISCQHGNLARSCEICALIAERDALREENTRFREKLDREKMEKVIYKASNDFQSDESIQFGQYWKDKWPGYISDALIKYLTE